MKDEQKKQPTLADEPIAQLPLFGGQEQTSAEQAPQTEPISEVDFERSAIFEEGRDYESAMAMGQFMKAIGIAKARLDEAHRLLGTQDPISLGWRGRLGQALVKFGELKGSRTSEGRHG